MQVSLDSDSMKEVVGGPQALEALLKEQITPPLELNIQTATETNFQATITLKFKDLEEYKSIAKTLLDKGGTGVTPEVTFEKGEGALFVDGYQFSDNIKTEDLLRYVSNAAVDQGIVSEENADQIWGDETYELILDKEKVFTATEAPFTYESGQDNGPTQIYMETSPTEEGKWNRTFALYFKADVYDNLKKDWDSTLFVDPDLLKWDPIDIEESLSGPLKAVVFQIKDANLPEIQSVTSTAFGDTENSLSCETKSSYGFLQTELKEQLTDKVYAMEDGLNAAYFFNPQTEQNLIDRIKNQDFLSGDAIAWESDLKSGFEYTDEQRLLFDDFTMHVKLDPEKGITGRTLTFHSPAEQGALYSKALTELLTHTDAEYKADETADHVYTISYDWDAAKEMDRLFFRNDPKNEVTEDFFSYKIAYEETLYPVFFDAKDYNVEVDLPVGAELTEDEYNNPELNGVTGMHVKKTVTGKRMGNIILVGLLTVLVIALIALIIYFVIKKKNKPSEDEDFFDGPDGGPQPPTGPTEDFGRGEEAPSSSGDLRYESGESPSSSGEGMAEEPIFTPIVESKPQPKKQETQRVQGSEEQERTQEPQVPSHQADRTEPQVPPAEQTAGEPESQRGATRLEDAPEDKGLEIPDEFI